MIRSLRASALIALCLFVPCLIGGCPQEEQAQSRAQITISHSRDDAATLRAQAAQLPDSDPRKTVALNTADLLDQAANNLLLGINSGKAAAANDKGNSDIASAVGNAIPVPWVGTAVTGVVAGLLGIQSQRRGKKLDEQTDEAESLRAQAQAVIHSIEAAKVLPAFKSALVEAAPLLNAVQSTAPGTKSLVDSTQDALKV